MNPNPEQPDAPPFTTGKFTVFQKGYTVPVVHTTGEPRLAERYSFFMYGQQEKSHADADLTAKAFNAATALHAAGWDAARVFERLPEVMRVLDHNCTGFAAQLKLKRDTAGGGR